MIEVSGVQNPEIKVGGTEEKLKRYFELMEQVEKLNRELKQIKEELKSEGIGVEEPQKFEIPEIGIVKVTLKTVTRETLDKKKAKELLPEALYQQIVKFKEVKLYEIRQVKR